MSTDDDFEAWWADLLVKCVSRNSKNETIGCAQERLKELPSDEKERRVSQLVQTVVERGKEWDIAAGIIEGLVNPSDIGKIESLAWAALGYHSLAEEWELTVILRILACADTSHLTPLLRYLAAEPLPEYYPTVLWATWPQHPSVFAEGYRRLFREARPERWRNTAIVQAFIRDASALAAIKRVGQSDSWWPVFKTNLREQLSRPLVTEQQRQAVLEVLGEAT